MYPGHSSHLDLGGRRIAASERNPSLAGLVVLAAHSILACSMLIAELLAGDVLLISTPMAVKFQYEWHDDNGQWYRSYGNEPWEFAPSGHATP
jgi:Protein of unknown function (DUF1348)